MISSIKITQMRSDIIGGYVQFDDVVSDHLEACRVILVGCSGEKGTGKWWIRPSVLNQTHFIYQFRDIESVNWKTTQIGAPGLVFRSVVALALSISQYHQLLEVIKTKGTFHSSLSHYNVHPMDITKYVSATTWESGAISVVADECRGAIDEVKFSGNAGISQGSPCDQSSSVNRSIVNDKLVKAIAPIWSSVLRALDKKAKDFLEPKDATKRELAAQKIINQLSSDDLKYALTLLGRNDILELLAPPKLSSLSPEVFSTFIKELSEENQWLALALHFEIDEEEIYQKSQNDLDHAEQLMIKIQTEYSQYTIKEFIAILEELELKTAAAILRFPENQVLSNKRLRMTNQIEKVEITEFNPRTFQVKGALSVTQQCTYRLAIFQMKVSNITTYWFRGDGKVTADRKHQTDGGWEMNWSVSLSTMLNKSDSDRIKLVAIVISESFSQQFFNELKERSFCPSQPYALDQHKPESLLSNNRAVSSEVFLL